MATDLQKKLVEVYKEIRSLCEENDIRYFAGYGTAIGAVRHHGVIPWDDDIDIEMPWKDYLRFIEVAKKKLPKHLKVLNGMEKGGVFIFSKVFDTRSTFFISHVLNKPEQLTGVYVDIFPIFGAPKGAKKQREFEEDITFLNDELWKARVLDSGEDEQKLLNQYIDLCSKYDFDDTGYVRGGFAPTSIAQSSIYPREWYDSYERFSFEDTDTRLPVGYDKLLSSIYGDYMTPPPKDKQVAHMEDSLLDLQHSYKEYREVIRSKDPVVKGFIGFTTQRIVDKNITIDNQVREMNKLYSEVESLHQERSGLYSELDSLHERENEQKRVVETLERTIEDITTRLENERRKRQELEGVKASAKHFARNVRKRLRRSL